MSSSIHAGISGNISFQIAEDQDEVDVFLNIFFYQHLQLCSFRHNCVLFVTIWFILSQSVMSTFHIPGHLKLMSAIARNRLVLLVTL